MEGDRLRSENGGGRGRGCLQQMGKTDYSVDRTGRKKKKNTNKTKQKNMG